MKFDAKKVIAGLLIFIGTLLGYGYYDYRDHRTVQDKHIEYLKSADSVLIEMVAQIDQKISSRDHLDTRFAKWLKDHEERIRHLEDER